MSIDPENLDIRALPSLPFRQRKYLPDIPSIYFVSLEQDNFLVYIGQTKSLVRRWVKHDQEGRLRDLGVFHIAWLSIEDKAARIAYERVLIRQWLPPLNCHHRGSTYFR